MSHERRLRTAVWYGDLPLDLEFPAEWDVTFFWPSTPPPLTEEQIAAALEHPAGQVCIRELARGKRRPLVIVDDPNRPTPAALVLPWVVKQIVDAGVGSGEIRVLVATGTHGAPRQETVVQKIGPQIASACRVLIHDSTSNSTVKLGRTSFGTRVWVNREVVNSDLVVGIGGIFPNHTAGLGGGSKLAMGVLGFDSIKHLHYRHQSVGWGAHHDAASFRKDLDEIARMIGMTTMISVQVDGDRQIVRVACGDPAQYFDEEAAFSQRTFSASLPGDADVVVSNAYPNDLSLTFAGMKGITPLYHCRPGASRIALASCSEGFGHHGLFPLRSSLLNRPRHLFRRALHMSFRDLSNKISGRLSQGTSGGTRHDAATNPGPAHPIWLYRPGNHAEPLPASIAGMRTTTSWPAILQAVRNEQPSGTRLRAVVYACAPLQILRQEAQGLSFAAGE